MQGCVVIICKERDPCFLDLSWAASVSGEWVFEEKCNVLDAEAPVEEVEVPEEAPVEGEEAPVEEGEAPAEAEEAPAEGGEAPEEAPGEEGEAPAQEEQVGDGDAENTAGGDMGDEEKPEE